MSNCRIVEGNRVISLSCLVELAHAHRENLDQPVRALRIGPRLLDLDTQPAVMGCLNLSRESTYRDSVAVSVASAVRRGRVLEAQGADIIDVGAESSTPKASRVSPDDQIAATPSGRRATVSTRRRRLGGDVPPGRRPCLPQGRRPHAQLQWRRPAR